MFLVKNLIYSICNLYLKTGNLVILVLLYFLYDTELRGFCIYFLLFIFRFYLLLRCMDITVYQITDILSL